MSIGKRLAKARTDAGLTQEQLAEKLYVTRAMVSKWERDICQPDYHTVLKIAKLLSVSPDDILKKEEAVMHELYRFLSDTDSRDLLRDLNVFLSTLNRRDRSIFIRRYYFLEYTDVIAENYGVKESNVRTILMRTRKKLKRYLEAVMK